MEFMSSTELDPRSISDRGTEPITPAITERLIELSSWMMVLGTIRFVCAIADFATALLERWRFEPWSSRMWGQFIQENDPVVIMTAAWPLILGIALRRTGWPELLRAAAVTFLILSIGGVLELTIELSQTHADSVTFGAFHLPRRAFSHPNPSDLLLGVLGTTQLLLEIGTAVRALALSFHTRRISAAVADQTDRARPARFGRLAVYASLGFLVLMIRLPIWSAYVEALNKYAFVRDFIIKNDMDRVTSRRRILKDAGGFTTAPQIDPFVGARDNYLRLIAYYDALPPEDKKHSVNQIEFSNILNNLAWLLATYPDVTRHDPEAAVGYARRAVELARDNGNDWNTLGVACYRAGKWQDAKTALERSMKLRNGGDSFDWFFLALVYHQLGQPQEARQWCEKAVRWFQQKRPFDLELPRFQAEAARELGLPEFAPSNSFQNGKTAQPPVAPLSPLPGGRRLRMRAADFGNPSR
jgi:tetratricopeptide (TPR) repeat protein